MSGPKRQNPTRTASHHKTPYYPDHQKPPGLCSPHFSIKHQHDPYTCPTTHFQKNHSKLKSPTLVPSAVFSEGTRGWHAQTSSEIIHILFSQEMTNVSISCDTLHSNRYLSYPRILLQEKLLFLICKMGIILSL